MSWIKFKEGNKRQEKAPLEKEIQTVPMKKVSIQDSFLNEMIKGKKQVTIYLDNGFRFNGIISSYDQYVINFPFEGKNQIIYKSSISTIRQFN